jgi:hypothetical protein
MPEKAFVLEELEAGILREGREGSMKLRLPFLVVTAVLAIVGMAWAVDAPPSKSRAAAERFAQELSRHSLDHEGVPLRRYEVRDLDSDGRFEVLEYIGAYEEAEGFLNDELAPAFEWAEVYRERDGRFLKGTGAFKSFLKERKAFYESWLKALDNPRRLSADSQGLIRANLREFQGILKGYLRRIEVLLRSVEKPVLPTVHPC